MKRIVAISIAVFALSILPFMQSGGYGLTDCDDYDYVTVEKTPLIVGGVSWNGAKYAMSDLSHGIWMPITWSSYMVDFSLFDGKPGAMHLHSVVLHGVNAALVFLLTLMIIGRFTQDGHTALRTFFAVLCAMVWAVHPLRVESAVWIASRKDVLSFFFELLAFICWIKGGDERTRLVPPSYIASFVLFVLATMAKPSAMTFPLLAFIIDWLLSARRSIAKIVVLVLSGAWGVGIALLAAHAQKVGGATSASSVIPLWWKCVNACAAFGVYLKNTVWPLDLAPQCILKWPKMPRFWWQGVLLSGVAALCVFKWFNAAKDSWQRGQGVHKGWPQGLWRWPMAGILWFIIAWGPMSGMSAFGVHAFADRFTYIPAVGISFALVGLLLKCERTRVLKPCITMFCAAVIALSAFAWRQTEYWSNDEKLWSHTLEVDDSRNYYALRALAMYHFEFDHDVKKVAELLGRALNCSEDAVGPVALMYVLSLCEDGRSDEASKVLSRLREWHERQTTGGAVSVGANDNPFLVGEMPSLTRPRVVKKSGNWDLAEAVWLATQGNMISVAQRTLDNIEKENPDHAKVLYLRGLFAKWQGNDAEAKRYWKRLVEHGRGEPYVRFRFVKKWIEEQEEVTRKDNSK